MKTKKYNDTLEKIHINIHMLFLCNVELKYFYKDATKEELQSYSNNSFLSLSIESIHIYFCLLSSILISEKEEYSITKFLNEQMSEGEAKRAIWDILYSYEFQLAWKKIKKLRDKCYAHNDKEEAKISKEIKVTQKERDIIFNGLRKSLVLIERENNNGVASFDSNDSPGIKFHLNLIKNLKEDSGKKLIKKINRGKRK